MNRTLAALVIAALLPLPARALDVALGRLTFTIAKGTSSCGGPALGPPPLPPFSGEVDNPDGTKRADRTLGPAPTRQCLNGSPGTDGSGACGTDTDCPGNVVAGAAARMPAASSDRPCRRRSDRSPRAS